MRSLLAALATLFMPWAAIAQQGIAPEDIRLELIVEDRPHPPHPGEMILLMIRGTYRIPVVRENLRNSSLDGFDWMQLGEDRWYKAREDGFEVVKFERRMALFPQRAGDLDIAPFVHELEMLDRQGRTVAVEEASNAVTVRAAPMPEGDGWWFPVRALSISDNWSNQPEALDTGAAALRIVAITVEGSAPQRIPPMPEMTGAGAFIFPHPEQKIVALGPGGPVTRVFWRWTVRPHEGSAGYLNPVALRYFDTQSRENREIELAAQRVAYADGSQVVVDNETPSGSGQTPLAPGVALALPRWSVWAALMVGFTGGLLALAVLWGRAGLGLPQWMRPDPNRTALRRAARRGDPSAVWRHARALDPHGDHPALLRLEKTIFGKDGAQGKAPNMTDIAHEVLQGRRGQGGARKSWRP